MILALDRRLLRITGLHTSGVIGTSRRIRFRRPTNISFVFHGRKLGSLSGR
jgi:hypothetical protein